MRPPIWTLLIALLVGAGYLLPYTLLAGVESWSAAFVFWLAFGVAVWVILVAVVARWNPAGAPR